MCLDYGRLLSGLMWGGPAECWGYMGGQGDGSLATGRGVQGLQCFLGLLGGQVQTSVEPGLGNSGRYYLMPAVIKRSDSSGKVHRSGMKGPP